VYRHDTCHDFGVILHTAGLWINPFTCHRDPAVDQILKPGVFEKLAELREQGHTLAIASNQKAVAKGWMTLAEAEELMTICAKKVGGVDPMNDLRQNEAGFCRDASHLGGNPPLRHLQ
jgi:hypothetical protein